MYGLFIIYFLFFKTNRDPLALQPPIVVNAVTHFREMFESTFPPTAIENAHKSAKADFESYLLAEFIGPTSSCGHYLQSTSPFAIAVIKVDIILIVRTHLCICKQF